MKLKIYIILLIIISISCESFRKEYDENAITIATFNIEWLGDGKDDRNPRNEYDYKRIAEILIDLKADVIGLQEVENNLALEKIIKFMPGYKYIVGETGYIQNPAFLYRDTILVKFVQNYKPLAVKANRTRPGLLVYVKKGNFDFYLMNVHFKSTSRADSTEELKLESYALRRKQAEVLRNWSDSLLNYSIEKDIIIIGDFNDNPLRPSKILSPLLFSNNFLFLTDKLGSCKNPDWDNIDHIVINKSVFQRFIQGSVYMYNIPAKYEDYEVKKISDHCPVIAKFNILIPDND
jgi:endonuclease/exonuclease/phosphatase family metal-dependent hydrolase